MLPWFLDHKWTARLSSGDSDPYHYCWLMMRFGRIASAIAGHFGFDILHNRVQTKPGRVLSYRRHQIQLRLFQRPQSAAPMSSSAPGSKYSALQLSGSLRKAKRASDVARNTTPMPSMNQFRSRKKASSSSLIGERPVRELDLRHISSLSPFGFHKGHCLEEARDHEIQSTVVHAAGRGRWRVRVVVDAAG